MWTSPIIIGGSELADQDLMRAQRRDHQLVEGAEFALAGDRQGGDDEADQQRDAGDEVRHHEPLIDQVRVEPVARHDADDRRLLRAAPPACPPTGLRRSGRDSRATICEALERRPSRMTCTSAGCPASMSRENVGPIWMAAMTLWRSIASCRTSVLSVVNDDLAEGRRALDPLRRVRGPSGRVAVEDHDVDVAHLERRRIGEDDELDDRRHDQDDARPRDRAAPPAAP